MKKILFLFITICFALVSCKSIPFQEQNPRKFAGVYRGELHFTADISYFNNSYKVAIKDEKDNTLLDMELPQKGGAVYCYISPLPKNTIQEFEEFFYKYLVLKDSPDIKKDSDKIYYYLDGKAILQISDTGL